MHVYSVIGAASTVVVGGGIATGLGFALKPASKDAQSQATDLSSGNSEVDNEPVDESIAPPTKQLNHSTNYLVTSHRSMPDNTITTSCELGSTCQLFSLKTRNEVTKELAASILHGNNYLLNIENTSLAASALVEVDLGTTNKKYFTVKSEPSTDKTQPIKPIAPRGLIARKALLKQEYGKDGLDKNHSAIQFRKHYNNQQDTYVERIGIDNDVFLIFKWVPEKYPIDLYTDTSDNTKVDKYLFKTFAEQHKDKEDGNIAQLRVTVNDKTFDSFLEIYEIKDQQHVTDTFATFNVRGPITNPTLNWDKMAKENLMITKLSQLKKDHYYKFVFENSQALNDEFKKWISILEIRQQISKDNNQRLFRAKAVTSLHHCIKLPGSDASSKVCRKFASS